MCLISSLWPTSFYWEQQAALKGKVFEIKMELPMESGRIAFRGKRQKTQEGVILPSECGAQNQAVQVPFIFTFVPCAPWFCPSAPLLLAAKGCCRPDIMPASQAGRSRRRGQCRIREAHPSPEPPVGFCCHLKGHNGVTWSLLAEKEAGGLTAGNRTRAQKVRGRENGCRMGDQTCPPT